MCNKLPTVVPILGNLQILEIIILLWVVMLIVSECRYYQNKVLFTITLFICYYSLSGNYQIVTFWKGQLFANR